MLSLVTIHVKGSPEKRHLACSIFQTLQERGWNNCGYRQRQGALLPGRHRRRPEARERGSQNFPR